MRRQLIKLLYNYVLYAGEHDGKEGSTRLGLIPYHHRLVARDIPHLPLYLEQRVPADDGLELSDAEARTVVEKFASKLLQNGRRASPRELAKYLSETLGRPVSESLVRRFFGEEKAYVLLRLRPQTDVTCLVSELSAWEEVESIDEVYGSVDLVLRAKLRINGQNLVERPRSRLPKDIEEINVLITD